MRKIYTIGRDEGCDIVIPDNTDVISRLHATIRVESNGKVFLTDQSRNGTYVNGMKMSSNVEIPISRKDVVSFAHIYNLDWSLVPKHRNNAKMILIVFFGIIAVVGIAYAVTRFLHRPNVTPLLPNPVEKPFIPLVEEDSVKEESTPKDTVVVVKVEEKPKREEEKKDTVKNEKPQEEIYNPVY